MHGVTVSGAVACMHGRWFDLRAGLNHTLWIILIIEFNYLVKLITTLIIIFYYIFILYFWIVLIIKFNSIDSLKFNYVIKLIITIFFFIYFIVFSNQWVLLNSAMHGVMVSGAVACMHGRWFDLRAGLNYTHWLVLCFSILYSYFWFYFK